MRRVVITVEDTLPNGKYVAKSFTYEADKLRDVDGKLPYVFEGLSRCIDNRIWIEGSVPSERLILS